MIANVGFRHQKVRSLLSPLLQDPKDSETTQCCWRKNVKLRNRGAYLSMVCERVNSLCLMALQAWETEWWHGNLKARKVVSCGAVGTEWLGKMSPQYPPMLFLPWLLSPPIALLPRLCSRPQPSTPGHSNLVPPWDRYCRHSLCQNDLPQIITRPASVESQFKWPSVTTLSKSGLFHPYLDQSFLRPTLNFFTTVFTREIILFMYA